MNEGMGVYLSQIGATRADYNRNPQLLTQEHRGVRFGINVEAENHVGRISGNRLAQLAVKNLSIERPCHPRDCEILDGAGGDAIALSLRVMREIAEVPRLEPGRIARQRAIGL